MLLSKDFRDASSCTFIIPRLLSSFFSFFCFFKLALIVEGIGTSIQTSSPPPTQLHIDNFTALLSTALPTPRRDHLAVGQLPDAVPTDVTDATTSPSANSSTPFPPTSPTRPPRRRPTHRRDHLAVGQLPDALSSKTLLPASDLIALTFLSGFNAHAIVAFSPHLPPSPPPKLQTPPPPSPPPVTATAADPDHPLQRRRRCLSSAKNSIIESADVDLVDNLI